MYVKWKHKLDSKDARLQGLCLFLAGALVFLLSLCFTSAISINTSSYSVSSFHWGSSADNISTGNYSAKATTTYQQAGTSGGNTTNYMFNAGGFNVSITPQSEDIPDTETPSTSGGGGWSGCVSGYKLENGSCVKIEEENVTEIPSQLFDITFTLDDYLIQSLDELTAIVTFESFGVEPTPVNLTFTILDEFGTVYAVDNDFIVVTTEEVLRKKFEALHLSEGKYIIVLETLYNVDVIDEFRQEFELGEERKGISLRIWIILGIILLISIIALIWWLIKTRSKKKK